MQNSIRYNMRNFFLFLSLFAFAATLSAQPLNRATYATMIKTADEQLEKQDYYNAIDWYEKAYEEQRDYDLAIRLGHLNYFVRDYTRAARWFSRALRRDKKGKYTEDRFTYAMALKMDNNYEEAMTEFQTYLETGTDETKKQLAQIEIDGIEYAAIAPEPEFLTVSNAGREINSKNSEYSAVLAPGGNNMYYASMMNDELVVIDKKAENYLVQIYSSGKTDDGWGEPSALPQDINREGYHTANVTLSPDGRRMYFTRQLLTGNVVSESKIFMSESTGGTAWGPSKEVLGVNGEWIANHPAVGELFGQEVLFFTSDMDGGEGGLDLYYATYKGDGVYGDPINMGPKLNTIGDEMTPYYRDGVLYFSSNGHPGFGGKDIFSAEWDGQRWSAPKNMGKVYNSTVDDLYFMLDEEGYRGFLVSNRPDPNSRSLKSKTCCNDIYNVNLKKIELDLLAKVFDDSTKEALKEATMQLIDLTESEEGTVAANKTNNEANSFPFALEIDKFYRLITSREDYFPDTVEFNTVGLLESKSFEAPIYLKPAPVFITITKENPIVLENIFYDFDDDKILPEAEQDLELVFELMTEYPEMVVELSSHTDARGNDNYNKELSQRRAESARRWLMKKDIPRKRIQAVGFGETEPKTVSAKIAAQYDFLNEGDVLTEEFINALETEEQQESAHQINRRTEFRIVEGPTSIKIEETRLIRRGATEVDKAPEVEDEKKN
jgi:peptidoglycan-associated lipoprotein